MALKLSLRELLYKKTLLARELEAKLPFNSLEKAKNDYHAKKPPRPCGATVHSVVGCSYRCAYCYLPDMGVSFTRYRVYGLSGEEMVYALLANPSFLPGRLGTLIAVGSVGEPFVDQQAFLKTLEYLKAFSKYLGNPTQFSTKSVLTEEQARALASLRLPLSPLVTVVSLHHYRELEPGAPPPEQRFETMRLLRKSGLHPILFLRPLIPGVNSGEVEELLAEAKQHGAVGVVLGGFRVSPSIVARLEKSGFDLSEVRLRIKQGLKSGTQTPVGVRDVKEEAARIAREKGLVPFFSACCANNYTAMLHDGLRAPCPGLDYVEGVFCTLCPVQCPNIKTEVDEDEVREMIEKITLRRVVELHVDDRFIRVKVEGKKRFSAREKGLLEVGYRRRVVTA